LRLRKSRAGDSRLENEFNGNVPVTAGVGEEEEDTGKEGVVEGVSRWVGGESYGWIFVVMDGIEVVDAPVSDADAGREGGGMAIASSRPRSR